MADFIRPEDAARVEAAIQAAEAHTRAELVAVVAEESDDYGYVVLALAALVGLAAPFPWSLGLLGGADAALWAHGAAIAAALAVLALGQIDALRRLVVPGSVMRRRAARNARAQFYEQRVRMTRDRAGVLLFVSVFEHHVEIIADEAAAAAVPEATWQAAVDAFVARVKAGDAAGGFLAAVDVLDDALRTHLPGDAADRDELPNRLIVL